MPAIAIGVGSIVGGIVSAVGAHKAASTQANAANTAAQMQTTATNNATAAQSKTAADQLALQKQTLAQQQANQQPWLDAGTTALKTLQDPANSAPWTGAFDPNSVMMDPSFQMRLDAGNKAIMNQASARGDNLGSSTTQALSKFNQDYTSNDYSNAYGRAQQQYQEAYQTFNDNQARKLNPAMTLAGFGQNAAGTVNSNLGNYTTATGNTAQGSTNAINGMNINNAAAGGDYATQAANAQASGYVGIGNAINSSIGPVTQSIAMSQMNQPPSLNNKPPTFAW